MDFNLITQNKNQIESIDFDFKKIFDESFVDLSEELPRPETLISIGRHEFKGKFYPTSVMTAGEMSAIVAPSKSMKSFFKSALLACYISNNSQDLFPRIQGFRDDDYVVIDIDTEQGKYYTQRTFRRVAEISKGVYKNYKGFAMRKYTAEERVNFVDQLIKNQIEVFGNKIKIISIDGIADFVDDTNDIVMSKQVSDKLMRWTDEYGIHIIVVIHKLSGSNKPVGHLGSFVTKKAETVFLLNRTEDNMIEVTAPFTRGFPLDPFYFSINKDGLPYEIDVDSAEIIEQLSGKKKVESKRF